MTGEPPKRPQEDTVEIPIESWGNLPKELQDSLLIRVFRELHHVQDDDRLLVLVTHGFIELLVNTLVDAKCKNAKKIRQDDRAFTQSVKLLLLHETGALSDFRYKSLDWFRKLRNRAAHEPLFEVSLKEISNQFNDVTKPACKGAGGGDSPDTPESQQTAHGLYQLCVLLIITLWSDHSRIFSPVFCPRDKQETS